MRRGSGEVDRRRASLGAGIPGSQRPGESIFDPNHAAILFRDSRGVKTLNYIIEMRNTSLSNFNFK